MATPAEAAAERLAWEMESWRSIELRVRSRFTSTKPDAPDADDYTGIIENHYIETAQGQRLFDTDIPGKENGGRSTEFADGKRFGSLAYDRADRDRQRQLIIGNAFGNEGRIGFGRRPIPLSYLYAGLTPLPRALTANGVVHLGSTRLFGRDADRFIVPGPGGTTSTQTEYVYTLDRDTGLPLEVVVYLTPQDRAASRPDNAWIADSFDHVQGHYLPRLSHTIFYASSAGGAATVGPPLPRATATHEVTEVAFDRDYPATTFWPTLQPGVMIWDRVTGKHWHQPNSDGTPFVASQAASSAPIRATEPLHWSASAPYVGLGIGGALLLGVALLRWRHRMGS